ncbi:uncharacterized protein METZ01_LOCUS399343 [marine metagenome]|uniref:Pilus assembly protein PilO n=1 Tax=marine metagenome TaxID=408172 RepID=A0A382VIZ4_9ZZZZ
MDLKSLFSRNKGETSGEPKKIKDFLGPIITISIACIFLLVYFFLFKPLLKKQENLIAEKYSMLEDIDAMNGEIDTLITEVEELELEREKKFKLFVSEKEVEELYQLISFSAIRNQLKVKKLIRGEEEAVRGSAAGAGVDVSTLPVDYYKIFVEYDIEGKFPNYLKLKEEIAELDKLIVFEKEEVKTTKSRTVIASVKISLVRMPTR